jgi:hypothetical protein
MMSDTGCEGIEPAPPGDSYVERHAEEPRDDELTARPVVEVSGLPRDLPAGHYAMTFSGMEYPLAGPPTLKFRYAGKLADDATVMTPRVYRTKTGKIVTDEMIEGWAEEAERGYELTPDEQQRLSGAMAVTRQQAEAEGWLPPREEERNRWPIMDLSQQPPDLYQVSITEVLNVSKLARVIAELLRTKAISAAAIGLSMKPEDAGTSWNELVEGWLRS